MRLSHEELNKIKEKYGVNQLWSFSKFDSYRTSSYEFFLKYVKKTPQNNDNSAYAPLGGAVHDIIEKLYEDEVKYEDMLEEFKDAWDTNIEIIDLKFDRSDSSKNDSIKSKYYADLEHFFKNYKMLPYKMKNEQFITIKVTDDIVLQGYADAVYCNEDGIYTIVDYKTSTQYTGKALLDHSAQLVLYSEALRQLGVPQDKIRCCFNFLKYVNIDCEQVNGNIKTRTIERSKIGESLQGSAKTWLKKLGHEDEMLELLDLLVQTNDISVLPEDVQAKYSMDDCYTYIDDIWDLYKDIKEEIIETVAEINSKVEEYNITQDEHLFWDSEESLKAQSYYFNNLSGYNIASLKPYKAFLDKMTAQKEGNIFGAKKNPDEYAEDDLSWLEELS